MESYQEKLAWARKHLDALNADMKAFVNDDAYRTVALYDPKTQKITVRFRVTKKFPEDWPLRVGDIVHNMRSALDALAYSLALKHSGKPTDKQAQAIQFLICDTAVEFADRAPRRHGRMSPAAQAAIESLQPYKRQKAGAKNELAVLRDLSNIDKHRHLLPCFTSGEGRIRVRLERLGVGPPITLGPPLALRFKGRLNDDAVLGYIDVPPGIDPLLDIAKKAELTVDVSLDEPAAGNAGISSVLSFIEADIRKVVIPTMESFL